MAPPAPTFEMPPPILVRPSPGLRIFLIIVLAVVVLITALLTLTGLIAFSTREAKPDSIWVLAVFIVLFVLSLLALVGVGIRAPWSRVAALMAGAAVSLTCIGLVLGIPILIAASRAPDLTRRPA